MNLASPARTQHILILLIQSPGGGLHGYNFTSSQWGNAVDAGEFMPLEPGVVAPAVAP
jgi:hypothetical protein